MWTLNPRCDEAVWEGDGDFFVDTFRTECSDNGCIKSYIISRDIRFRSPDELRNCQFYNNYPDNWFAGALRNAKSENTPGTYEMKFEIHTFSKTLNIYFGCKKRYHERDGRVYETPDVPVYEYPEYPDVPVYEKIGPTYHGAVKIAFIRYWDWYINNILGEGEAREVAELRRSHQNFQLHRTCKERDGIVVEHYANDDEYLNLVGGGPLIRMYNPVQEQWVPVYALVPMSHYEPIHHTNTNRNYQKWQMYFPPDQLSRAATWVNKTLRELPKH